MAETNMSGRNVGILSAFGAYASWGLLPLYWKQLSQLPSMQILSHRMIWSFLFISLILIASKPLAHLSLKRHSSRTLLTYFFSGLLIGVNWLIYIWAVNTGHVLQASLGYFLNPIANVLVGAIIFKEKLSTAQKVAAGFAAAGVFYLMTHTESGLWISILLAGTFCIYAVVRKHAPLNSMDGMYLETLVMFPLGVAYLVYLSQTSSVLFSDLNVTEQGLLMGSGVVTALPLLFFSDAAKRLPFATLGMFQYLSPTLQFLLAVFAYHETFTNTHLVSFLLIWTGLIIYSTSVFLAFKRAKTKAARQSKPKPNH